MSYAYQEPHVRAHIHTPSSQRACAHPPRAGQLEWPSRTRAHVWQHLGTLGGVPQKAKGPYYTGDLQNEVRNFCHR
jgi:hypothetical protein